MSELRSRTTDRLLARCGLSLILVVGLLSSCTTEPAETTITFACPSGDVGTYRALAESFSEEHPGVTVQLREQYGFVDESTGGDNLEQRLQWLRGQATWSDVLVIQADGLAVVEKEPVLLDLSTYFEEDGSMAEGDFVPVALSALRTSQGLYGIPIAVDPVVIVYDRDLFDQARVAYPEPEWTWDDFLAKAEGLTVRGESGEVLEYGYADEPGVGVMPWLYAHGASLWRSPGEAGYAEPNLQHELVAEALQWYVDLALEQEVMPPPFVGQDAARVWLWDLRDEQRVAMWSDMLSSTRFYLHRPGQETSLAVAPLPQERAAATPVRVWAYAVSAGTAHAQDCWEWVSFLSQQAGVPLMVGEGVPARTSAADASLYWSRWSEEDTEAIRYALEHAAPASEWDGMTYLRNLDAVLEGQIDVEAFLAAAQQRAEADVRVLVEATPAPAVVVHTPEPPTDVATTLRFITQDTSMAYVYGQLAEAFMEEHAGINVEVLTGMDVFPSGTFPTTEMLAAEVDVFTLTGSAGGTPGEAERQYLMELTPFITLDGFPLEDFIPPVRPVQEGGVWGIPLTAKVDVAYLNRTIFEELGVDLPQVGWTWDDLIMTAEAITRLGSEQGYFGFADDGGWNHFYFLIAKEAPLVDMGQNPPAWLLDSPDMEVLARQWVALNREYGPGLYTEESGDALGSLVMQGRVGMWVRRSDDLCRMQDESSFEVGIVPLPPGSGPVAEVRTAVISAQTERPREAWRFVRYLSDHALAGGCRVPVRWSNVRTGARLSEVDEAMLAVVEDLAANWTSIPTVENLDPDEVQELTYVSVAAYCFGEAMAQVQEGVPLRQALQQAEVSAAALYDQLVAEGEIPQ